MTLRDKNSQPIVLSIAGYDPSAGAGITADIKSIAAHGCYGITCVTALTVQSTQGVRRIEPVDVRIITETLEDLASDFSIAAVKIGMLGSAEVTRAVASFVLRNEFRYLVLDPVLKSSSGMDLLSRDGVSALKSRLLSLAYVITPNIDEAAALTGLPVTDVPEMEKAAVELRRLGARNVIVTGGHLDPPVDVLYPEGSREFKLFKGKKITGRSTHGTGCAFSASLACNLALGMKLAEATQEAKKYVAGTLKNATPIGKGRGPVNHLFAG